MSAMAVMQATHGNLRRGETEGFAMSTRQTLGETVRGYELHSLFALGQRALVDAFFSGQGHCQVGPALAQSFIGTEKEP